MANAHPLTGLLVGCLVLCACSGESVPELDDVASVCTFDVVFHDFYDRHVFLTVDGQTILDEVLSVEDDSTGLNVVKNVQAEEGSDIHLLSADIDVMSDFELSCAVKLVYVQPSYEPYIDASESDVILLD